MSNENANTTLPDGVPDEVEQGVEKRQRKKDKNKKKKKKKSKNKNLKATSLESGNAGHEIRNAASEIAQELEDLGLSYSAEETPQDGGGAFNFYDRDSDSVAIPYMSDTIAEDSVENDASKLADLWYQHAEAEGQKAEGAKLTRPERRGGSSQPVPLGSNADKTVPERRTPPPRRRPPQPSSPEPTASERVWKESAQNDSPHQARRAVAHPTVPSGTAATSTIGATDEQRAEEQDQACELRDGASLHAEPEPREPKQIRLDSQQPSQVLGLEDNKDASTTPAAMSHIAGVRLNATAKDIQRSGSPMPATQLRVRRRRKRKRKRRSKKREQQGSEEADLVPASTATPTSITKLEVKDTVANTTDASSKALSSLLLQVTDSDVDSSEESVPAEQTSEPEPILRAVQNLSNAAGYISTGMASFGPRYGHYQRILVCSCSKRASNLLRRGEKWYNRILTTTSITQELCSNCETGRNPFAVASELDRFTVALCKASSSSRAFAEAMNVRLAAQVVPVSDPLKVFARRSFGDLDQLDAAINNFYDIALAIAKDEVQLSDLARRIMYAEAIDALASALQKAIVQVATLVRRSRLVVACNSSAN